MKGITLNVATTGTFVPFTYYDENGKDVIGFDLDVIDELQKLLEFEIANNEIPAMNAATITHNQILFHIIIPIDRVYVDKETGLPVRTIEGNSINEAEETTNIVIDYKYEFGTVTDENFEEPDRTKYKINGE